MSRRYEGDVGAGTHTATEILPRTENIISIGALVVTSTSRSASLAVRAASLLTVHNITEVAGNVIRYFSHIRLSLRKSLTLGYSILHLGNTSFLRGSTRRHCSRSRLHRNNQYYSTILQLDNILQEWPTLVHQDDDDRCDR